MVEFHKTLSDRSVYLRYFGLLKLEERILHNRLRRASASLITTANLRGGGSQKPTGKPRNSWCGSPDQKSQTDEAEFAILISGSMARQGLGTQLLRLLVEADGKSAFIELSAIFCPKNTG